MVIKLAFHFLTRPSIEQVVGFDSLRHMALDDNFYVFFYAVSCMVGTRVQVSFAKLVISSMIDSGVS